MTKTDKDGNGRMGAASARRQKAGATASAQRSTVVRMNLFVLVRILFQYLERVDPSSLDLAKEVLKDCERKHNTKDSKYETLADAINERVRDAVGESHWSQARKIQKQLMINQQRKRLKAMKGSKAAAAIRGQQKRPPAAAAAPAAAKGGPSHEAMEAAETMSALAGVSAAPRMAAAAAAPAVRERDATPPRSNTARAFSSSATADEDMGDTSSSSFYGDTGTNQDGSRQG